jgi:hypothetical protein
MAPATSQARKPAFIARPAPHDPSNHAFSREGIASPDVRGRAAPHRRAPEDEGWAPEAPESCSPGREPWELAASCTSPEGAAEERAPILRSARQTISCKLKLTTDNNGVPFDHLLDRLWRPFGADPPAHRDPGLAPWATAIGRLRRRPCPRNALRVRSTATA